MSIYFLILILGFVATPCLAENEVQPPASNKTQAELLIPANYSKAHPPTIDGDPVLVSCRLQIYSFKVDEPNMIMKVELYLNVSWRDQRLESHQSFQNKTIVLEKDTKDKLWVPNIYLSNEINSNQMTLMPEKIYLKHKRLHFAIRHTASVECFFQYEYYPLDKQNCDIKLQNFYESIDQVRLELEDRKVSQFLNGAESPIFDVGKVVYSRCESTSTDDEKKDCRMLTINLDRKLGYHYMQTFIPSALVVIVSWVSLWIDVDAVPGRVGIGVTTLLTLTTQFSRVQGSLPPVSYVKAIDVWMLTCLVMVFAVMIEFTIAYQMKFFEKRKAAKKLLKRKNTNSVHPNGEQQQQAEAEVKNCNCTSFFIDCLARVLFPLTFILFNLCFWLTYLV